ncbi:MAG: hypothetical protein WAN79_01315 [Opitutaceae bacterium]
MNMRIHPRYLIATVAVLLGAAGLHAQSTGTNGCTITIPVVNQLSITGTAVLTVPQPAAGAIAGGGAGVSDTSDVKLFLTTNQTNMEVTVAAGTNPPTGVTLGVTVNANSSSLGTPSVSALSTSPQALITGISNVATNTGDPSGVGLTYTLTLTAAATDTGHSAYSPTITYTLQSP